MTPRAARPPDPPSPQYVAAILAHYDAAALPTLTLWGDVPNAAAQGLAWYDTAAATAAALSAGSTLTERQCAGIIAALSPRVTWRANVRAAAVIVAAAAEPGARMPRVAGVGANVAKAWRIAMGQNPLAVLGGDKVRSFYRNITGDVSAVTVDVWARYAATGERSARTITGPEYQHLAACYRAAAAMRNVAPRDMQAAVWCHVRGSAV